jgi:hypothetical protein
MMMMVMFTLKDYNKGCYKNLFSICKTYRPGMPQIDITDDDDVYLGYYSGKMVSYKLPCLHVLRKTHKLSRYSIRNEHRT